jgi:hypothetical protein
VANDASGASDNRGNASRVAAAQFREDHPQAKLSRSNRGITRVHGSAFEHGNSPEHAAQRFVDARSQMFGVEAHELRPGSKAGHLRHTQPLMYDRESGRYKFTLVVYSQFKQDLPVFRSDLRMLVRNEPDSPLVLAASALRNLTGDPVAASLRADLARPAFVERQFEAARQAAVDKVPTLINFSDPEVVIWAGVDDEPAEPAVALQFIADNHGVSSAALPEVWLFLADARSGQILYEEYLIRRIDVNGTVRGRSTDGVGADICEAEVLEPMPYSRVNIGGTQAFADESGYFTIPNAGDSEVTVQSPVRGQRFVVTNWAGSNTVLSTNVTPPETADFVHNDTNSSEFARAEVNGYVESNVVRDWIVVANPSYPLIGSQIDFPVVVNRNDGFCPGNAWYDPGLDSINFCRAGSQYPNTAWSSVVYHEYGHHLVAAGGSGQGQYGEGIGDVMSTIILDDPRLGFGFFGNCTDSLRSADNTLQYPCSGGIHFCGQLISGCVWDTRNELILTEPVQYQQILMDLVVNSVPLHAGSTITPSITTDWLTLDDDNGDLADGTPHSAEILAGFDAHNMVPPPPPANDTCADAVPICPGTPQSGSTISASSDGSSICGDSGDSPDAWYSYTPDTSGTATFSLCGGGTNYDSVLSVHSGCPGTSTNDLGCDDDACGRGGPSEVTMSVTAGTTYLIRVTGWNGSVGDFSLTVSGPDCSLPCTGDSECDDLDACTTDICVDGVCVNNAIIPCCSNLICEEGENCENCSADCIGQDPVLPGCGNGYCEPGQGEDCLSCAADCRGKQKGKPDNRYCCGDGDGIGGVGCLDARCAAGGFQCSDDLPAGFCCGDMTCAVGEDSLNCELDCGVCVPSAEACSDSLDNDCDGATDCADIDCVNDPACSCFPKGASCSNNSECCTNKCRNGQCRGG